MPAHPKICPECSTPYHAAATFCQLDGSALVEQQIALDPLVGTRLLDQFDVLEAIGSGGMGTVYRAHQASLQRDVAIKILHRDLAKNTDAVRRFQREARVASSLDHANLVDVYLFGELADGSLYLVMEYLEGRTLGQALFEDGHFPLARALRVAHATAMGVGAAHRQGIVHRDVKPENVMLVLRDGDPDFVKVLDFGIARLLWDEQSHITQSGVIFGTARYISPEGASGEATDARSDVYSLAVLTYQLLSGSVPFDDVSPVALLMKHLRQKAPPLETRPGGAHVPAAIAEVVMRGLNKHPDARHDNAAAFARALESAAASSGVAITPEMSRAAVKGSAATLVQTGALLDVPAPALMARPHMATRRDGSVMPAIGTEELARMAAIAAPAGAGLAASPVHARQMMPVVELPVLQPVQSAPRMAHELHTGKSYDESFVGIQGLTRQRSRSFLPVLAGILIGVLGVGGVLLYQAQRGEQEALDQQRSLEERAREALAHGAIDSPPGDNVLELTRRLLERDPAHAGARSIRREAALLLRERAANARAQNDVTSARDAYEQVLHLFPEDAAATEGLRLLGQVQQVGSAPPRPAGIHFDPEPPAQRERVRLVGVFGPEMRLPSEVVPEFTVLRAGRRLDRLPATPGDVSGTWVADYAFAQAGAHEVTLEFGVGAQRVMLRQDVSVDRPNRPGRAAQSAAAPTPVAPPAPAGTFRPLGPPTSPGTPDALPPPPAVTPVPSPPRPDGIDWAVPDPPGAEPPPWTG